jgi:uncharacterized protein YeaO (DUF488 family)
MSIRIVRLGTPRHPREGVRIGTVRRPPRGVPKSRFAADNWFDVWLPSLAPSQTLLSFAHTGKITTDRKAWARFAAKYRSEMKDPDKSRLLDLLAAMSHTSNFSVGCFCEDESRCHRRLLRSLLEKRGAKIEGSRSSNS